VKRSPTIGCKTGVDDHARISAQVIHPTVGLAVIPREVAESMSVTSEQTLFGFRDFARNDGTSVSWATPGFRRLALSETKPNNRMKNQRGRPRANFSASDSSQRWASQAQHQPTKSTGPTYRADSR